MADILKKDVLRKRAVGKSVLIKTYSVKERLFVLRENVLTYYLGDDESGKEKGKVDLSKVRAVEKIADITFDEKFCFQIVFEDESVTSKYYYLYIFAKNEQQRDEWIDCLRNAIIKGTLYLPNYHDGAYINGIWTCCLFKEKNTTGCKTTSHKDSKSARKANPPSKVIAKHDFIPVQDGDLQLFKNQEYVVLDSSNDPNWWYVRDCLGREGYIPANYVERESETWFKPEMERHEADALLNDTKCDGTFIVHYSKRPAMYTLAIFYKGEIKHYHIRFDFDGKYYISHSTTDKHFDTIAELVQYHQLNSAGLVTRLRFPYSGVSDPPAALGHSIFRIPFEELQFKSKIGQGQFATVYEALWKEKEKVAVKTMKEWAIEPHDFIEEARMLQRFKHKNLVSLYGISYSPEFSFCIVIEYMKNGTLLDYIRRVKNTLSYDDLVAMIFQVSSAMMYLENEKFIHRDLAARNCLVGHNNLIKVGDFGLARFVLDDEYTTSVALFPIRWSAPEVIDHLKFSSKSDVWAFGVLCWEVFTLGLEPYANKNDQEIINDIRLRHRLCRPMACSEAIYNMMKECWEQNPEDCPSFKKIYDSLSVLTEDFEVS